MSAAKRQRTSSGEGVVHLSVRGTPFAAKPSTLRAVEGTMLSVMFDPDSPFKTSLTEDGAVNIDQDPEAFSWILGWLRRGSLSGVPSPRMLPRISEAADYLGLDGLVEELRKAQPIEVVERKLWATKPSNWESAYNDIWNNRVVHAVNEANKLTKEGWSSADLTDDVDSYVKFFSLPYKIKGPHDYHASGKVEYRLLQRTIARSD
tara:strand:+ start:108 stop:722 length:615 start_codon:yes stop_codon:yes gene_type:complete